MSDTHYLRGSDFAWAHGSDFAIVISLRNCAQLRRRTLEGVHQILPFERTQEFARTLPVAVGLRFSWPEYDIDYRGSFWFRVI